MAKEIKKGTQPDDKKVMTGRRFEAELAKVGDPAAKKLLKSLAYQTGLIKGEK